MLTAPRSYGKQWIDEMKTAKDFIGKKIMVPIKVRGRNNKAGFSHKEHIIDKISAERIARNVNIINELVGTSK